MWHLPARETLRQVWVQQFHYVDGILRWREAGNLPPASRMIYSPYDVEARYGKSVRPSGMATKSTSRSAAVRTHP